MSAGLATGRAAARPRVLVIDDGLEYARLVAEGMPELALVQPAAGETRLRDGIDALAFLDRHAGDVDVVLLDVKFDVPDDRLLPLPGASPRRLRRFQGVAILRELRRRHPALPVVLLTAVEDLSLVDVDGSSAAQSMTYFLERDDVDTLRIRIAAALQARRARDERRPAVLWGADPQVGAVRRRLQVLARGTMPVILEGETGTGKSFLAEHYVHPSSQRRGPFVSLDLATVPRDLVAAHLFGALRGSYTGAVADRPGVFEAARGGTLFIDEIQNVPLEVQKQLLMVLQERRVRPLGATSQVEVDVKVIAGSNEPLDRAVAEGRFRQDLYMRLGPATRVRLPPLRERRGDLPFLIHRFVAAAAAHPDNAPLLAALARASGGPDDLPVRLRLAGGLGGYAGDGPGIELILPAPAYAQLKDHPWPGNVRELAMAMHHLVSFTVVAAVDALRGGVVVTAPRLQIDPGLVGELLAATGGGAGSRGDALSESFQVLLQPAASLDAVHTAIERQVLRALFTRTRGDFARMAEVLLGDASKGRAVRLRFDQIGLKVRDLRLMSPAAWALALWATAADPAAAPPTPLATPAEAAMPETTPDEGEAPPVDRPYLEALVDRLGREGHAEGLRHLEAGELPQALKALLEAQELDPTDPGIEHDLARTYHRLGNVERAERAYRAAVQLDPERAAVYLDLADLLMASGKRGAIEEARRVLTGGRELLGNVTPVLVRQARAAAAAGDAATAERLYLDLVAPGPAAAGSDDPAGDASWIELSIELGDYYRDLGRWDEALHTYRDAAATGDQVAGERVRQTAVEAEARRLAGRSAPPTSTSGRGAWWSRRPACRSRGVSPRPRPPCTRPCSSRPG